MFIWLQQYLPFTVLKLGLASKRTMDNAFVSCNSTYRLRYWNRHIYITIGNTYYVATVLTVYGIETSFYRFANIQS